MRLLRIVCVTMFALAACGGDDTGPGPEPEPIPEPQEPEPQPQPEPDPEPVTVVDVGARGDAFDPVDIRIAVGTTVRWTNFDTDEHSVTSGESPDAGDAGAMFDQDIHAGETFEFTFDAAGSFPYHCVYHYFSHGMRGTVIVE